MGRLFRSDRPVPPASASPPLLRDLLRGHPRRALVSYLWSGFTFGFALGYQEPVTPTRPRNLLSARSRRSAVTAAVALGVSRGTPRALSSARRSGSSIAPPTAPRRGPTAPCAWFRICPRLEEPRLNRAFPERSLRYGIPPWMRPWPLCAAWGGTRLWRKRTSATPSASALCGPRIGRSCATRGKSGYMSTSGSLLGPALPPSFLLSSRRRFTGLPYTFAGAAASSIIFWHGPHMLRAPATCKLSRTPAATSVSPSRRRSWSCRHAASSSWASPWTPLFRRCASLRTNLHCFAIGCPRGGRGRNAPSGSCCS